MLQHCSLDDPSQRIEGNDTLRPREVVPICWKFHLSRPNRTEEISIPACIINVSGDNLLHLFVVQMTQMATYFALVQVIISIVNVSLIRLIFRAVKNLFER